MYDDKEKKLSDLDESHKKRITELDKKQEDLKKSLTSLKEQNAVSFDGFCQNERLRKEKGKYERN